MKKRLLIWVLVLWGGFTPLLSATTFEGVYLINAWQEANILDTVNTLSQSEITLTITEKDSFISVTAEEIFSDDYILLSENSAGLISSSGDDSVCSLLISNGSHLAMTYISDQTNDSFEREISLLNGSWLSSESGQPADISSLFGMWNLTQYGNDNLRNGIANFELETRNGAIKAGSSPDTALVQFHETWIEMQISGSKIFLDSDQGPVDTGDGLLYQFEAWFDEAGFSYTMIGVEDDDDTDVSVTIGYSNYRYPVPEPGSLLLFTTGLFGLAMIKIRRLSDIQLFKKNLT